MSQDQFTHALLTLEDRLTTLEQYLRDESRPSKRILKALVKKAQFHMRRSRAIYFNSEQTSHQCPHCGTTELLCGHPRRCIAKDNQNECTKRQGP